MAATVIATNVVVIVMAVAVVFAMSLTARALDRPLCAQFLIGTHWLWHLLNGIVLGSLIVTLIRHGKVPLTEKSVRTD